MKGILVDGDEPIERDSKSEIVYFLKNSGVYCLYISELLGI